MCYNTKLYMNYIIKYFLLILILLFTACQSEEILGPEDTYEEYTVVQAEIIAGKYFPSVRFTKTLPLGIPYDINKAELKNVTAYLVKNEVQVIPLIYTSEGLYKPLYDFYVQEGETYELYAESNKKFIYGRTLIPYIPQINTVGYNGANYSLTAEVKAKLNEVYGALWIVSGTQPGTAVDFYSVTTPATTPYGTVGVRTSSLPELYRSADYSNNRYIQVYSFDTSFRNYFYSRSSGGEINDPFIQGGGAIEWNMQGDKVIGMFIGVALGEIIKVNP